jgi:hypothetical protein
LFFDLLRFRPRFDVKQLKWHAPKLPNLQNHSPFFFAHRAAAAFLQ